jgi:ribonuclease BN (tRNA processing enzyme)
LKIKILGAHNAESKSDRLVSFVIDDVLAVEGGALTSELTFEGQSRIQAILLSHGHYDHIRAIPAFAFSNTDRITRVLGLPQTLQILSKNLMDDIIYPDFSSQASFLGRVVLELIPLEALRPYILEGYTITPVPVNHPVPAAGFVISSPDGKQIFFTGDSGPGLERIWGIMSPRLIIADVTFPNELEQAARDSGHLCPDLLKAELLSFRQTNGYLPSVLAIHISPRFEEEIRIEIGKISEELGISIDIAHEGQEISV